MLYIAKLGFSQVFNENFLSLNREYLNLIDLLVGHQNQEGLIVLNIRQLKVNYCITLWWRVGLLHSDLALIHLLDLVHVKRVDHVVICRILKFLKSLRKILRPNLIESLFLWYVGEDFYLLLLGARHTDDQSGFRQYELADGRI